jgi:hypothetical protein
MTFFPIKRGALALTLYYMISPIKYIYIYIYAKVIGFLSQVVKEKKYPLFHPLDLEILMFDELYRIL